MDPVIAIMLWIVAIVMVGVGIVGLIVPGLPGSPILFGGLVAAAWAEDFAYVGWRTLGLLAVMAVLVYVLDFLATALGADRFGASWRGIVGALCGAVVGLLFAPVGILVGPFLGAMLGELTVRGDLREAMSAGLGATIGLVVGVALKVGLAALMIGVFVFVRLWGAF